MLMHYQVPLIEALDMGGPDRVIDS